MPAASMSIAAPRPHQWHRPARAGRDADARGAAPARLHRVAAPGRAARRPARRRRRRRPPTARSAKPQRPRSSAARRCRCSCPTPSEEACRRHYAAHSLSLPHRRARAVAPHPVRGHAGGRCRGTAQACRGRAARRALPRRVCPQTASPTAARKLVQLPERRRRRRAGLAAQRRLRTRVRARKYSAHTEVGVLPRLVHSRFGLHVVEVLEREPGAAPISKRCRAQ